MEEKITINKGYLNKEVIQEAQKYFEKEAFIQLTNFLSNNTNKIKENLNKEKFELKYNPMQFKKKEIKTNKIINLENIKLIEFFRTKEFIEFIENITGFELIYKDLKINKFEHKDYTILNDKKIEKEDLIEIIYDLSDEIKEDMGGTLTYTTKEEEVFYLEPTFNSLTILFRPTEIIKYLKYINNKAKNKNILRIQIQFRLKEEY